MNAFNWQSQPRQLPQEKPASSKRPHLGQKQNGLYALSRRPGDAPIPPRRSDVDWSKSKKISMANIGKAKALHRTNDVEPSNHVTK